MKTYRVLTEDYLLRTFKAKSEKAAVAKVKAMTDEAIIEVKEIKEDNEARV